MKEKSTSEDKPKSDKAKSTKSVTEKSPANPAEDSQIKMIIEKNLQGFLDPTWEVLLREEFLKPYWSGLQEFLEAESKDHIIYPPIEDVFSAFKLISYDQVKVVILGQDPYHGRGEAHGLAFSVLPGVVLPPSLRNIYKELESDLGIPPAKHGHLIHWAKQGVLLLNTVLTVRADRVNSHQGKGWEYFTDAVIDLLVKRDKPIVFVLWGNNAKKKKSRIDLAKHVVVESAHPSPLSARNGFFGSKPFSKINQLLEQNGESPIDWNV